MLTFLQKWEQLSFGEAAERLRVLAGGSPGAPNGSGKTRKKNGRPGPPDRLASGLTRPEVLGRVAESYHKRLRESPEALEYLASRALGSRELWDAFRIGYADCSLLSLLPQEGPVREALAQLGVLNSQGLEHFRGCLVVPLTHPDQGVVGLYGRDFSFLSRGFPVALGRARRRHGRA